jgi:hypothetical protein
MPFDHGLRLNNRQRIANAREKPIKANKNQAVDGAEAVFLRSGSPQNVYLLPQHPNFHLKRCPRPKQICDHPNNEPDKVSHPAIASPDSRSTASQIEFAIGTTRRPAARIGRQGRQRCPERQSRGEVPQGGNQVAVSRPPPHRPLTIPARRKVRRDCWTRENFSRNLSSRSLSCCARCIIRRA